GWYARGAVGCWASATPWKRPSWTARIRAAHWSAFAVRRGMFGVFMGGIPRQDASARLRVRKARKNRPGRRVGQAALPHLRPDGSLAPLRARLDKRLQPAERPFPLARDKLEVPPRLVERPGGELETHLPARADALDQARVLQDAQVLCDRLACQPRALGKLRDRQPVAAAE